MKVNRKPNSGGAYNVFWKRLVDLSLGLFLLIVLSPFFLVVSFIQLISSGLPIFYKASRGGYKNKPFKIIKFRTMVRNADQIGGGTTSLHDPRITRFGSLLRKTKIDEFPQLINVIIGDMSFVGPRPELLKYTNEYDEKFRHILDVRPGITDLSSLRFISLDSVVGSNNADQNYEDKVLPVKNALRLKYANEVSFGLDWRIFWKTVWAVLKKMFRAISPKKKTEMITMKSSKMRVSRICFGGCPMGGYGWGKTNEDDFIEAVNLALDLGINYFDTSDVYGLGESERILGKALALHNRRSEAIIQTKFGVRRKGGKTFYDNSPEWIRQALSESLARLGTTYIDIYVIHYRDGKTPLSVILATLKELQKEGKIRYFGMSNVTANDLPEYLKYRGEFVNVQDEFSLATRDHEQDLKEIAKKMDVTPLTWGSLGQGILAGKIDEKTIFGPDDRRSRPEYVNFHGEKFKHNLEIVKLLKELSQKYQKPVPAVAMRFILDYMPQSAVLFGVKNCTQLKENMEALNWHLSKTDIKRLEKESRWNENTQANN
jgi:myo-inositol catabolism protein IolS